MHGVRSALTVPCGAALDEAALCREIVESDRRYFAMGARIAHLPGAEIAYVPGLAHCASAVAVQRVSAAVAARLDDRWLVLVEDELAGLGASTARIYLDDPGAAIADRLRDAGYQMRRETALAAPVGGPAATAVELREVRSPQDWRRKLRFHQEVPERPDGHHSSAEDWVRLERAKCAHGLRMFLAWRDGEVIGTIGLIPSPGPWRIKNIVVHEAHRRQSAGRGMIARVGELAAAAGAAQLCLFGVEGTIGDALYRACGFVETGCQVEWSKDLARAGER